MTGPDTTGPDQPRRPAAGPTDPRDAVEQELQHHIEERVDRLVADGMTPEAARRAALSRFGDVEAVRREVRLIAGASSGRASWMVRLRQDLLFVWRQLRREPSFTVLAVATLAIGIAASVTMFGLVKAVVLDPLPYPEADRLVVVNQVAPDGLPFSVSVPDYSDLRTRLRTVEDLSAARWTTTALESSERAVSVSAAYVTSGFFSLFGGEPALGQVFDTSRPAGTGDVAAPGVLALDGSASVEPVLVAGHAFWQQRLGGDPDAIGRDVQIDGRPFTVVGVMPAGWNPLSGADIWLPLPIDPLRASREDHFLDVFGRLTDEADLAAAREDAEAVAHALATEHPRDNGGWGIRVEPLKNVFVGSARIRSGWVLLGAVALLLLLACASVSNLLLARASTRGAEVGVRVALGATRGRLAQQFLTESLVLGLASAALGVALAALALPAVRALAPADTPRIAEAAIDLPVLLFALATAVVTSLLFGLAPVLHVARHQAGPSLSGTARGAAPARGGTRGALVAAQVAITVVLLVGVGLLTSTFSELRRVETGLPLETTFAVPLVLTGDRYEDGRRAEAVRDIRARLEAVPGVAAAGTTNIAPFSGSSTTIDLAIDGRPVERGAAPFVRWRAVGPGYFQATGLAAGHGRLFEAADFADDAESVVVIGESLARLVVDGPPGDAVGRRIAMGWDGTNWRRIVGVVDDVEDLAIAEASPLTFYMPVEGGLPTVTFLVRLESAAMAPPADAIRQAIGAVDPSLPVPVLERLGTGAGRSVAAPRFTLAIVSIFATVAFVIAIMGVYGVTLYSVQQRTREIGVRLALGARPAAVVRLILGRVAAIAAVGVVTGLVLAGALSGVLDALLFRTSPRDPVVLAAAAMLAGVAALVATWLPARRAAGVDPTTAIK